ncbi:hypothetical protein N9I90_03835 [Alphaproteobacteria bacterium]|nr:hypothetical protein [Alphaproteobacteria bacterium]
MKKIKILVTCIGGTFSYPILNSLKDSSYFDINIIGVDASSNAPGQYICDHFYIVPHAAKNPDNFWEKIQEIIKLEKPDLILPLSESETLIFANKEKEVLAGGSALPFGSAKTVKLMLDKFELLNFLHESGVTVGKFSKVSHLNDLEVAKALGFPGQKIVLKPRTGTGSRGVVILDDEIKEYTPLLEKRMCGTGNFKSVNQLFANEGFNDGYLAMPYAGPDTFDVDCLFSLGKPNLIIPRLREYQNPLSPTNEGCIVEDVLNNPIVSYIEKIGSALAVDGVCDFDVARNPDGEMRLLDASCRLSGSVGASIAAGYPIIDSLILNRFGLPIPKFHKVSRTRVRPCSMFFKT